MVLQKSSCDFRGRNFLNGTDIAVKGGLCECVEGKWVRVVLVGGI